MTYIDESLNRGVWKEMTSGEVTLADDKGVWALLGLSLESLEINSQARFEEIMHEFERIALNDSIEVSTQDVARTQLSELYVQFPDFTLKYLERQLHAAFDTGDDTLISLAQKRYDNFAAEQTESANN